MEFSRPEYWSGWPFPSPGNPPNPRIEPRSPTLQADSLPAEPPGKPKNTEMGSLFLLQQIFPTQESNQSLLHCWCILYQLNYQGILTTGPPGKSPDSFLKVENGPTLWSCHFSETLSSYPHQADLTSSIND